MTATTPTATRARWTPRQAALAIVLASALPWALVVAWLVAA